MYGLKRLPADNRLHIGVRRFLKMVRVLPWDVDAADYYADIRHQLATAGRPISGGYDDRGAFVVGQSAVLVTNNTRHYEQIKLSLFRHKNWV